MVNQSLLNAHYEWFGMVQFENAKPSTRAAFLWMPNHLCVNITNVLRLKQAHLFVTCASASGINNDILWIFLFEKTFLVTWSHMVYYYLRIWRMFVVLDKNCFFNPISIRRKFTKIICIQKQWGRCKYLIWRC